MKRGMILRNDFDALINGDVVLVKGISGIVKNGVIELADGSTSTDAPDYVIRIPETMPETVVHNITFPELEVGDRSMYVEIMQTCLKWHGYGVKPDGDFGQLTFDALRRFRNDCYLSGDTVCDAATWERLLLF